MGEYIKYRNEEIKIGTCESLYYATYQKFVSALDSGELTRIPGNADPSLYSKPDSGFLFRFPFPDEKALALGEFKEPFDRGIPITIRGEVLENRVDENGIPVKQYQMEITFQKLIHRESDGKLCLALIWCDPVDRQYFRVEGDDEIRKILTEVIRHHIVNEKDQSKKEFYREIAFEILKGYSLGSMNEDLWGQLKVFERAIQKEITPKKTRRHKKHGI